MEDFSIELVKKLAREGALGGSAFVHERLPNAEVLYVFGDVDLLESRRLDHEILQASRGEAKLLTIDLEFCSYIDFGGINVLVRSKKRLRERLELWSPKGTPVRRVLEIAGLSRLLAG